ncbi:TraR/DksA family transcriptional regulator [Pseudomonas abietaniphila]|uniref:TraR/DksA family transcriptional regulator n=1 Tax=Pseudomonas abietaniphila TaxID=89065 RepID=UPI001ABF7353|nr:TraR/DksA family transcriptional regulator [Pseudomonas abietaniphila]
MLAQDDESYMLADQLAFFRNLLQAERANSQDRITTLRADLAGLEKAPDEVDAALTEQERQTILQSIDREGVSLREIALAIAAVDDGTYGYCADTGEKIGLLRLLSYPRSLITVEAKQHRENRARHLRAA